MNRLEERRRKAEMIAAEPHDYKVCDGCGSIVRIEAVMCPVCKHYRFDESPAVVAEQARLLGSRESQTLLLDEED
jgi:hypothetical protein